MATKLASDAVAATEEPKRKAVSDAFRLLSAPVLLNVAPDRVSVLIAVSAHATGWVEFGETEALGKRSDGEVGGMRPLHNRILRFDITGLKPGKGYFYRIRVCPVIFSNAYRISRGTPVASELFSFRTLNPSAATASFTCWNDTHENRPTLSALTDLLQRNPTDFLVWNGDITNDIHREEQLVGQFIDPAGKPFAASTPLFLGRGNHDVRGRDARHLAEMMTGPDGRYYYAFRQGPLACLVMDTGEDKPDELPVYAGLNNYAAYRTEQARWLADVIKQPWFRKAAFRVAFLHIPLLWEAELPANWATVWGAGIKGWICEDGHQKWHDLLCKGNVDAVISGHTHRHAWFAPRRGRPYAQLIGGGPAADNAIAITGHATSKQLQIDLQNLEGKVVESHLFRRK
ncbi:MAG: metallophosphoesterase [Verrucomicrobia bacterium]|nr:metallophosphoesterase [Verrucomicrobiota bacterium]